MLFVLRSDGYELGLMSEYLHGVTWILFLPLLHWRLPHDFLRVFYR